MRLRKTLRPPNRFENALACVVNLSFGYGWQTLLLAMTIFVVLVRVLKPIKRK